MLVQILDLTTSWKLTLHSLWALILSPQAVDMEKHLSSGECPKQRLPCKFGCGVEVLPKERDIHELKCTHKPVSCGTVRGLQEKIRVHYP